MVMINYIMAVISSLLLCAVLIKSMPSYSAIRSVPLPYFSGGFIGVLTTYLFNVIIPKIPAVYIVILRFIGQMFTSAAIDYIYLNIFSKEKIIGGALFLIELTLNAKADQKYAQAHLKLSRNGIH